MKNKNDKVKIIFIVFLLYLVLSWVLEGGIYSSNGEFTSVGIIRMGLYDIVSVLYSAFYFQIPSIAYLLAIGGCYQVLSETNMYRKLVDKVSNLMNGKEEIAMVLITIITAVYASLSSNILILFVIAPFIVTLFLRNNYNRLVAFSAGFGGMFLGYLGLTYGTYNNAYFLENMVINNNDWIIQKWVILLIGLVVFNVFSIIYMRSHKDKVKDATKYDMFATIPYEEVSKKKGKNKKVKTTRVWPLLLVGIISIVTLFIGYIDWSLSFDTKFFNDLLTKINDNFVIADVPIVSSILGSQLTAFGTYKDLVPALFILLFGIVVISIISKVRINDFLERFGVGMKKIAGVAFIYGLANSTLFLVSMFPWPIALVNNLLGSGTFNIIIILIIGIIATILIGDGNLTGFLFAAGLASLYSNYLVETAIIWRVGCAIATIAAPTSYLLLTSLTYLSIPYKNWISYIWKFIAIFMLILLIFLAVVIYA